MTRATELGMLAATLLLGSCGDSGTNSTPNGPSIQALASLAFSPAIANATTGASVTFVFGSVGHTVVFDPAIGRPEDIATATSNKSVVRAFNTPGDFSYHCTIHSGMSGRVHVTDAPLGGAY